LQNERTLRGGPITFPYLVLRIRREYLIQDTLTQLAHLSTEPDNLKKELKVKFENEEAVDEGGVQKEFFQLIVRELFDPKYGMFILNTSTRTYWFNCGSTDFEEYKLIGTILGLAIYNGVILDVHFPFFLYKKLTGLKPTLEDLKSVNPGLSDGLKKLQDYPGDVEADIGGYFQISYEEFGVTKYSELKPQGASIPITNVNRREFVDLYIKYFLEDSISRQYDAFQKGFQYLCNSPAFKLFRPEELELSVCGSPILDFEALEKATIYENGYSKDHQVIKWFWDLVHHLPLQQQKCLLFFATGSDRAPIGGLGKLGLVIVRHGADSDRLPQSHTCFNHLMLPEYSSKDKLETMLLLAVNNAEGFGML